MLKYLEIAQYVIISKLRIDFRDALTVMTGETGAGKSILLDALGLVLGDPPDREAIRQDCKESTFKACFEIKPDHAVWGFVQKKFKLERPADNSLTVSRTFDRKELDEIELNGKSISLADLKQFGIFLVEIHGQFANQTFLAPETQINLLDSFGNYPDGVLQRVIDAWAEIARVTHMLNIERAFITTAERDRRPIEQILASVEALKLKETTYVDMVKELTELKEIRDISDMFHAANSQLVAQTGVEMSLICVDKLLASQKDPMLDEMKKNIKESLVHARVAIAEMMRLAPKYLDVDTSGIEKMESDRKSTRLNSSHRLTSRMPSSA
jgi:DNA repair protein RecN (Recombination protein N)